MRAVDFLLALVDIIPIVLLSVGVVLLIKITAQQREQTLTVVRDLEIARLQGQQWRSEARTLLNGLGDAIDEQFKRWNLTEAEREGRLAADWSRSSTTAADFQGIQLRFTKIHKRASRYETSAPRAVAKRHASQTAAAIDVDLATVDQLRSRHAHQARLNQVLCDEKPSCGLCGSPDVGVVATGKLLRANCVDIMADRTQGQDETLRQVLVELDRHRFHRNLGQGDGGGRGGGARPAC